MKPSKYQEAIYQWVKTGTGNCVVEAIAGSGKTHTLKNIVSIIPTDKRVLMLAFNKSIVDELSRRIQLPNVKINTSHSLGYGMLKQHFKFQDYTPQLNVDEYKYKNYIKKNFKDLAEGIEFADKTEVEEFKETILSLIDMCRFYLCKSNEDIEIIAEKYNYAVNSDHIRIVKNVINWGQNNLETIDFGDMICLPNYLDLSINTYKYDWVCCDEVQDFSIAQQELIKRCAKKSGTRYVFTGDPRQCIQSFAGSDNEAFQKLKSFPNTITLPLSINYRCPQSILDKAKSFVPQFQIRTDAPQGILKHNVLVKDIKDNSMVICRKTQPLIGLYLRLLKSNRKCYIKGFDIGNSIIEIIEKLDMLYVSADFQKDGIIPKLYRELLDYRATIMKKYKIDVYDASNENTFQRKLEMINTISALAEDTDNTYELIDRCKKIFYSKNGEGICLITNHKAKGLESDVVYHLCPSLLPDKRAKKEWEIQTERNLEYVLYTRTRNEFYTVSEEDFPPPQGSRDVKELVTYLNYIEQKLKILYSGDHVQPTEKSTLIIQNSPIPIIETEKSGDIYIAQNNLMDRVMQKKSEETDAIRKFERIMNGKTIEQCYEIFNDFGITSDINIIVVGGKSVQFRKKGKKDTINVEIDNDFDKVVTKVIRIGK